MSEYTVPRMIDVELLPFRASSRKVPGQTTIWADVPLAELVAAVHATPDSSRRIPPQKLSVRSFGARGDGVTDDFAAFAAALARIEQIDPDGELGAVLHVPAGTYRLSETLHLRRQVTLRGHTGAGEGGTSRLVFDAGVAGIIVHHWQSTGGTGSGEWSHIERLHIVARGQTADVHGVELRGRATLRNVQVEGFAGNGIHADVQSDTGAAGNANLWQLHDVRSLRNRGHGLFVKGGDVNGGLATNYDAVGNGGWGVYDWSFLGNTYVGCHTSANGLRSRCWYDGRAWWLRPDKGHAAASTEPGHGNVWVAYRDNVASPTGNVLVDWSATPQDHYLEGGAFRVKGGANDGVLVGCYSEGGQPPSDLGPFGIALGGTHGAKFTRDAAFLSSAGTGLRANGRQFHVGTKAPEGHESDFVFITEGTERDPRLMVRGRRGTGAARIQMLYDWDSRTRGELRVDASGTIVVNGAGRLTVNPTAVVSTVPFRGPVFDSAKRPDPAAVGVGAQVFDRQLGRPVWSDGTRWVDASGTPVA